MRLFVYAAITINQENNKPFIKPLQLVCSCNKGKLQIGNRKSHIGNR